MSKAAVLNALTRLLLVVTAVLYLLVGNRMWLTVLVAGLVTIVLLYFFNVQGRQGFREGLRIMRKPRPVPEVVQTPEVIPTPETISSALPIGSAKPRDGLVGTFTKELPKTSMVRLDGVERTRVFRKR